MSRKKIPGKTPKIRTCITIHPKEMDAIQEAAWRAKKSFSQYLTDAAVEKIKYRGGKRELLKQLNKAIREEEVVIFTEYEDGTGSLDRVEASARMNGSAVQIDARGILRSIVRTTIFDSELDRN